MPGGRVGAGLLRWLPVRGRADGLTAVGVAGVRGGSKAALMVAVVELHRAGVIAVGPSGQLRRVVHAGPGGDATLLHRAVWSALGRDLSLADAAAGPGVRRAEEAVRAELAGRGLRCGRGRPAAAGLLSLATAGTAVAATVQGFPWIGPVTAVLSLVVLCAPLRTLAGYRLLRELRRLHPVPASGPVGPEAAGLLVALHGRRALRVVCPEFAARAGLLGARTARETVARSGGPYEGWSASLSDADGS
ncbi:TIGR04222 domain-containing membrane protein [Kitasatospora sp. NPDC089797]|uniref:TIGR04222 domain-containing membrane protein n=1 Tax=Kitasatospora sp. NPDC089797 TaxID=3155298 RepID=UPI0034481BF4